MWQDDGTARQQVRRLTTIGEYAEAERTVQRHQLRRQAELDGALESLAQDAARQWSALQRAKAEARLQEQSRALTVEQSHFQRLLDEQSARCQRSEAVLARYSAAEKKKLNSTPLNVPLDALILRDEETRFILQGRFAAAAKSRRDAARAEHDHVRASFLERNEILDRRVSRQAASLLAKEFAAAEKDQLSVTALQRKHAEEEQRAMTQVHHVEDGMLAAQRRTQQLILKMRRTGDVSRAASVAAHRGAALERRVYGDAYRVPSLCEYYGPLLDQPASALPALPH
ncbi:hypothetical protein NQL31_004545 [Lotmaria passim]